MRKHTKTVWKVYCDNPSNSDEDESKDYIFTNLRAASAFERAARYKYEVVAGPFESFIYSTAKFAALMLPENDE